MKWHPGRQNPSYEKFMLWNFWRCDCYLIRYKAGSAVDWHFDPCKEGYKHYRLNIRIYGEDAFLGRVIWRWWRFILFRPDITCHAVKRLKSRRLILSIGWLKHE